VALLWSLPNVAGTEPGSVARAADDRRTGRARALLSPGERHVETLIAGMAEDERRLRDARAAAESARAEADRLRRELDERSRKAEDRRADLLAEARAQAAEILRQARREADDALRALRRAQSGSAAGVADVESARTAIRQQLDELTAEPAPQAPLPPPPGGWRPGMAVRVRSLRQTGRLLARPGPDGTVPVQVGILRVNAAVGDLDAVAEPQTAAPVPPARTGSSSAALAAAADLPAELDLRGLRADEALERLDRYLDDMALAGRAEARIIHGKGTGALRQAVGEYLHGHRLIASYRLGETGEGGDGVTVITLRG
jgi:DNA mismatch repair protein MutS2